MKILKRVLFWAVIAAIALTWAGSINNLVNENNAAAASSATQLELARWQVECYAGGGEPRLYECVSSPPAALAKIKCDDRVDDIERLVRPEAVEMGVE
jgi:hypothetical protein